MKRFKNVELAEMYKVSEKSIRNWIEAAKEEKLSLELIREEDKVYIANTPGNHLTLKHLSEKGKKFKNKKALKIISPKETFYKTFSDEQIINIITDLETYREIDLKYIYLNDHKDFDGAVLWDDYFQRSLNEPGNNTPKNTLSLLDNNINYIYDLIKDNKQVNIIDIGVGNALPVKNLIEFLLSKNLLKKYIGLDYSDSMLNLAKKNLKLWFGENFQSEFYIRDLTYDGIRDLLFINTQDIPENSTVNLILFIGSTVENQRHHRHPLQLLKNSMCNSDLFVMTQTLDSEESKRLLNFTYQVKNPNHQTELFFFIPDLLGLKPEHYDVERFYSEKESTRVIRVKLKSDIHIKIKTNRITKTIKLVNKDKIVLWRHRHHSLVEGIQDLSKVGFQVLHATTTPDYGNLLVAAKVKKSILD